MLARNSQGKAEEIRRDLDQNLRVLRRSAKRKLVHTLEGEGKAAFKMQLMRKLFVKVRS